MLEPFSRISFLLKQAKVHIHRKTLSRILCAYSFWFLSEATVRQETEVCEYENPDNLCMDINERNLYMTTQRQAVENTSQETPAYDTLKGIGSAGNDGQQHTYANVDNWLNH